MKRILAILAFGLFNIQIANAATTTISFDQGDGVLPYSEDGFTLTGNALDGAAGACPAGTCDPFRVLTGGPFYSSATFIDGGLTNGGLRVGEGASFTQDNGGLFKFDSFQYRSAVNGAIGSSQISDAFDLLGFRNGLQVVDYGNFETASGSLLTILTGDDTLIDSLLIIGTKVNQASTIWDNFVFDTHVNAIPLPAGLPMLGAGLLAFGFVRRAKRG